MRKTLCVVAMMAFFCATFVVAEETSEYLFRYGDSGTSVSIESMATEEESMKKISFLLSGDEFAYSIISQQSQLEISGYCDGQLDDGISGDEIAAIAKTLLEYMENGYTLTGDDMAGKMICQLHLMVSLTKEFSDALSWYAVFEKQKERKETKTTPKIGVDVANLYHLPRKLEAVR